MDSDIFIDIPGLPTIFHSMMQFPKRSTLQFMRLTQRKSISKGLCTTKVPIVKVLID